MILTTEEYERKKSIFLNNYSGDINSLLASEMEAHLKEQKARNNWKYFVQYYAAGFIFLLVIAYFCYCKELFTFSQIAVFAFLQIFTLTCVYGRWEHDVKCDAITSFECEPYIIRFMFEKMVQEREKATNEDELYEIAQFYAVALYDIPRNEIYFDLHKYY